MSHILETAGRVISGQRQQDYGEAGHSFAACAQMWSAYKGVNFTAQDVAMMMILLKVSRSRTKPTEDTLVDICGYAALADKVTNAYTENAE